MCRPNIQIAVLLLLCLALRVHADESDRIKPYDGNPFYWQYKGKPVLLIGGTDDDNPFNQPDELPPDGLASHLDLLQLVGGNYIRNTMSSRDPGSLWPFKKVRNGKYDLKQWNPHYWDRFDRLLQLAYERDIIVQIEIWDPWDYFVDADEGGWSQQPFHPLKNVNYTLDDSQLKKTIDYQTRHKPTGHNFFHTVPELEDNRTVLKYQEAFVSKILEHSLAYPNVLYCLSNEIGEPLEWSVYWARFIHAEAKRRGIKAQVADMRRANSITAGDHRYLQDHPDLFTFLDISQNNGGSGWARPERRHWDPIMKVREYIADHPRPLNNTKIYGSGENSRGGVDQALQKFWRSIFAGCASVRFHRPAAGPGLSKLAQRHIRSARMLAERLSVESCRPYNDLLSDRVANEAYCMADPGRRYAVYFPHGGSVSLKLAQGRRWEILWLDAGEGQWGESEELVSHHVGTLEAPHNGHHIVVLVDAGS